MTDAAGLAMRIGQMLAHTYVRYIGASVAALGVDVGCFLALHGAGLPAVVASGLGYSFGIVAHWLLSSRAVFTDDVARGEGRIAQQALFLTSAIVGLGITMAIVGVATALGFDPRVAKAVAVIVAFQSVWLLRRHIVFAR
ncbi:GtrA family protein [Sphingomonas sp. 1P06PA]|uniref:GtrA family protein n=1 Tax=Sphingomonas sp. 1P06PA TaxID=554121 RepID=UPI0039A6F457